MRGSSSAVLVNLRHIVSSLHFFTSILLDLKFSSHVYDSFSVDADSSALGCGVGFFKSTSNLLFSETVFGLVPISFMLNWLNLR